MRAPARLREQNARHARRQREVEILDRFQFALYGEDHECRLDDPCSRDYDPLPYPEATPHPTDRYVGTGVGALYGLSGDRFADELAGWRLTPRGVPGTPSEETPVRLLHDGSELARLVEEAP